MASYENASLWKNSLSKKLGEDQYEKERDSFRVQYELFRDKARILAGEINRDLPNYTVHDITHIDALWDMASIIAGENYELNPAEAFVLGGAFLIHDLGMGLAAYPEGKENLKEGVLWKDKYCFIKRNYPNKPSHEIEKETLEIVLRELHAIHAEKLALISWGCDDKIYLIDDGELRSNYGAIIGKIAHSHWWSIEELVKKLPGVLGAPANLPNEWSIDTIKLACIMRVADASHIDSLRAPAFLNRIRKVDGYSQIHWKFQEKLYQPRPQNEQLVYTSKSSFNANESASWWVCYDTLNMISRELSNVDMILRDANKPRLYVKSVAGIGNIDVISKLIGTSGWKPVDAKIHVSQVVSLVKNLGGTQLYGKDYRVPLRELIQNGCDAINARKLMEGEDSFDGKIVVRVSKDDGGDFLEVEDNGVGMSERVISGPFLDFGNSFWGTSLMHEELPGLESKGFRSTGKFGVGFFSVFMIGENVKVTSRRFEDGRSDTKVLTFDKLGLDRPLLRNAQSDEYLKEGGTKVKVYFKSKDALRKLLDSTNDNVDCHLTELMEYMCPTLDVDLYCESYGEKQRKVISANDWLSLEKDEFIRRLKVKTWSDDEDIDDNEISDAIGRNFQNCEVIYEDDKVVGRGYLMAHNDENDLYSMRTTGVITVGGFRTNSANYIAGFLLGDVTTASRNCALPSISRSVFADWFVKQTEALRKSPITCFHPYYAQALGALGKDCSGWKFINSKYGSLALDEFESILRKNNLRKIYLVQDAVLTLQERKYNSSIELNDDVFFVEVGLPSFINADNHMQDDVWSLHNYDFDRSLKNIVKRKFIEFWGSKSERIDITDKKRVIIGKVKDVLIMENAEECEVL